jgi:DnaK suppressor protein
LPGAGNSGVGICMDKRRLEGYRKSLIHKREDLLGLVRRTEVDGRTVEEVGTQDLADKAASSYTKEFLFYQSSSERTLLQLVEEALGRIERGSYGECVHCGGPMQEKRLDAVPWARHCIPCQELQDQGLI